MSLFTTEKYSDRLEKLPHGIISGRPILILKLQSTPGNSTLYNSNLPLTRSNFYFPSEHFLYNFILDNSNSR